MRLIAGLLAALAFGSAVSALVHPLKGINSAVSENVQRPVPPDSVSVQLQDFTLSGNTFSGHIYIKNVLITKVVNVFYSSAADQNYDVEHDPDLVQEHFNFVHKQTRIVDDPHQLHEHHHIGRVPAHRHPRGPSRGPEILRRRLRRRVDRLPRGERPAQAPARGATAWVPGYQDYRELTGYADLLYAADRKSAVVTVTAFSRTGIALTYSFNGAAFGSANTAAVSSSFTGSFMISAGGHVLNLDRVRLPLIPSLATRNQGEKLPTGDSWEKRNKGF
ncbi:hypothetical protein DFH09DRAFT_1308481 [Mycena vulgaris]|nr:hypothetical protein DFH09DRAFT_1308481 [Mycena vulgaris]